MNKKNMIYAGILIVLVVIFVLIKFNNKTEKKINFFDVDSAAVTKIEINDQEDTLHLVFAADKWKISFPVDAPVKESRVKDFFEKVLKVETSKMPISVVESFHENYKVTDSLATHVKIIGENNKILADVYIGKSSNYSYAFGRKVNDNKVYQLKKNISYNISPKVLSWREKEIFKYEDDQIMQIDVSYDKIKYQLTFADSVWIYTSGKDKIEIKKDNKNLKNLLSSLKNYNASDFKDNEYDKYQDKFTKPDLKVTITTFENDKMLLRYIEDENNKFILQKNDETEHLYLIYKNLVDKFKKTKKDFTE